ncbi:MAG: hypothetical protein ACRC6E_09695 [Fusobacteriaceae bacterium]
MNKFLRFRCDSDFILKVKKLCDIKGVTFTKLIKDYLEKEFKKNKI